MVVRVGDSERQMLADESIHTTGGSSSLAMPPTASPIESTNAGTSMYGVPRSRY